MLHRFKFCKLQIKKLKNNKGQKNIKMSLWIKEVWSITKELLVEKKHM